VSLLTGSVDPHYQWGLLSGLLSQGIAVELIGSDAMSTAEVVTRPGVKFLNFRGDQSPNASIAGKIGRVLRYYLRLVTYAARTRSKVFHIQWPNKFVYFDRTILNIYYKLVGKKLVLTAHNINDRQRDGGDTAINRFTLRMSYSIVDRIIVHTRKMRDSLISDYRVKGDKIWIVPHGINSVIPLSSTTRDECRSALGIGNDEKVLLFFGNIAPYKGLEYLILALDDWRKKGAEGFILLVAGRVRADSARYWNKVERLIVERNLEQHVLVRREFIHDHEIELYCKGADVMVLPYTEIFQSGVLFVSYRFGLPVIAADVGSFSEDIVVGTTGFLCKPQDPSDLAAKIDIYFRSELYRKLEQRRSAIMLLANSKYSWEAIGKKTCDVYRSVLAE
jgi:D-inositol-3-phosphate glycosyltransferase